MIAAFGLELEYPSFYILFALLIPLAILLFWNYRLQEKFEKLFTPSLIPFDRISKALLYLLPLLILAFSILALMGPRGDPRYSESDVEEEKTRAAKAPLQGTILFLIDTSMSMLAEDTSTKESRLSAAKELAEEVVSLSPGAYKGVFVLGKGLVKATPRTTDTLFSRLVIRQLEASEGGSGTEFLPAFEALGKEVREIPDPVAVVVLSDGEDPLISLKTEAERKEFYHKIAQTFLKQAGRQVPIYTVGFGTREGGEVPGVVYKGQTVLSRRDDELLKTLSKETRGAFFAFEAENKSLLAKKLKNRLGQKSGFSHETLIQEAEERLIWNRYFQIPLFLALLLFLTYLAYPRSAATLFIGILYISGLQADTADWERGAKLYGRVIELINGNELDQAELALESLKVDANSSPYVLGKIKELEAVISLEKREKLDEPLKPLMDLYALSSLESASLNRCRFQSLKGYKECPPSYFIDQMKKGVKSLFQMRQEETPLGLAAFGLEWADRARLTLEEPSYYESFLALMEEGGPSVYRDALNNFQQKDFDESVKFFEREALRQGKKIQETDPLELYKELLSRPYITLYDVLALNRKESAPALMAFKSGNPLWGRLLMTLQYFSLLRKAGGQDTPKKLVEAVINAQELAFLAAFVSKEVPRFGDFETLDKAQKEMLSTLAPFLEVSRKFREEEFLKSGCETEPWSEIIPLYEKGKKEAEEALVNLGEKDLKSAMFYQLAAEETFRELLNLLEGAEKTPEMSKAKEALSETVMQFQDFELQDRALTGKPKAVLEKTERPW